MTVCDRKSRLTLVTSLLHRFNFLMRWFEVSIQCNASILVPPFLEWLPTIPLFWVFYGFILIYTILLYIFYLSSISFCLAYFLNNLIFLSYIPKNLIYSSINQSINSNTKIGVLTELCLYMLLKTTQCTTTSLSTSYTSPFFYNIIKKQTVLKNFK